MPGGAPLTADQGMDLRVAEPVLIRHWPGLRSTGVRRGNPNFGVRQTGRTIAVGREASLEQSRRGTVARKADRADLGPTEVPVAGVAGVTDHGPTVGQFINR